MADTPKGCNDQSNSDTVDVAMSEPISDDMACQELVTVVTDYFEGTLPDHQRARFEAHLLTCPGCREYVEQMRITIRISGRLTTASISPAARAELLRAFRRMRDSKSQL
jgi:anti-sigma factor RsiW